MWCALNMAKCSQLADKLGYKLENSLFPRLTSSPPPPSLTCNTSAWRGKTSPLRRCLSDVYRSPAGMANYLFEVLHSWRQLIVAHHFCTFHDTVETQIIVNFHRENNSLRNNNGFQSFFTLCDSCARKVSIFFRSAVCCSLSFYLVTMANTIYLILDVYRSHAGMVIWLFKFLMLTARNKLPSIAFAHFMILVKHR